MSVTIDTRTGPVLNADGPGDQALRQSRLGALTVTDAHGRLYEASRRGQLFVAQANITAPVIFSTAAGTGGPLLWNGGSTVTAHILAIGYGVSVVTTVAAALGITGNTGQSVAPTTTTAIDGTSNLYLGGAPSVCTAFRIGTPAQAGKFLLPFADLHTGALTVDTGNFHWITLDGAVCVPPACWASVAASATATTTVMTVGMIWEEVPI